LNLRQRAGRLTELVPMFRLAYGIAFVFLLWLFSLFTQTEHIVQGGVHVFKYNWVPWAFLAGILLLMLGFAEIARRILKDRGLAIICVLLIPGYALLSLQFIFERVEVSDKLLKHRREPPHTRYNADIPWDSIQAATKIEREQPGLFAPNFYNVGYEFVLRGGQTQVLPSNTVLTRAHDEIDRMLAARNIPVDKRRIPIQR
jgi:hypothetical protein